MASHLFWAFRPSDDQSRQNRSYEFLGERHKIRYRNDNETQIQQSGESSNKKLFSQR